MTLLFVELAGLDEAGGTLEPEDLSSIAADFTREAVAIAIAGRGTVTSITAQSMMILFEGAHGHESSDHAAAAVTVAVRIRDMLSELVTVWRRRGISAGGFAIRAGINTGFCTVGVFGSEILQCYTAVGSPVQVAARLMSEARAGQILCAQPALALVEERVQSAPHEGLLLQGMSRPVEVVEILELIEAARPERVKQIGGSETSLALAPGHVLGHYQILKRVGASGMGEVYRARDTRLDRVVALKLLRAGATDDPQAQPRFLREARAVAALKHPNIVSVYSVEETAGRTFITMELIDGEPLSDLIPGSGLEPARLRQIALQLTAALASAHSSGVTHRDLKPANVMIERNSTVKVLDFGLAKMNKTTLLADTTQLSSDIATQAGVIMGTVPYMSPEQIQGRAVDQRTDIFSLGVFCMRWPLANAPSVAARLPISPRRF